jgi:hypothetical protein
MQDYEKLGVFYSGREYDAATRAPSDNPAALRLARSHDALRSALA